MRNSSHALLREGESRRELFKNSTWPRIIQAASQSLRKDSFLLISPTKMPSHARRAKAPLANRLVVIWAATSDSNSSKATIRLSSRKKQHLRLKRDSMQARLCYMWPETRLDCQKRLFQKLIMRRRTKTENLIIDF